MEQKNSLPDPVDSAPFLDEAIDNCVESLFKGSLDALCADLDVYAHVKSQQRGRLPR